VRELRVKTERKTQLDVTAQLQACVDGLERLATVFVPHATAGAVAQAAGEGDANPWSCARRALAASPVSIPLDKGRLALGLRQALFLAEFDGPPERTLRVVVTQ
jgi:thiamine phosphate synthase YjbQ (UPF0047 family)